ncbi:hypothetical protein RHGRI_017445 [Rhododendron griersonianum]|uniref:Uncharacterized protein n=1 Tax=Rhododendron griersonianum TaxID=479676 RepID=A0AAV6JXU0_9ERIC|nr:hypothetical protein RHGRI_017445 [Rhododendron griersonianum]
MRYEIGQNAYIKLVLQALNHNTSAVNGLLLGRLSAYNNDVVEITEFPLFHSQIDLLPPLEIALIQIYVVDSLDRERIGKAKQEFQVMAVREVWPRSLERINLVEPSQSTQRAGQSLIKNLKNLPLIHSYDSIQSLTKNINKSERDHDLVIASYVLGEIPSQQDRITIVRQLWDLTQDVLVLVEPGTPHGFNIILQMRSYILWMEKRKRRKSKAAIDDTSKDLMTLKSGAFVVAPCAHDGRCPLDNTGKYCHFVQRLQRTTSQRVYKEASEVEEDSDED